MGTLCSQKRHISFVDLEEIAREQGLESLYVSALTPPPESVKALTVWQQRGFAGEMSYMRRDPQLLSSPVKLLPAARSVVLFALRQSPGPHPVRPVGYGRVARYAWGRDYHVVIRERLRSVVAAVSNRLGAEIEARVFSDSVPLLERSFAAQAGMGFIGKSCMLIRPKVGTYFFIGEIVWELEVDGFEAHWQKGSCGTCENCINRCPTKAFASPMVLDARRCISYLSIEKRGMLDVSERESLGEWVFGCDVCQDVCPFNHRAMVSKIGGGRPEFECREGPGALLDLQRALRMRTAEEFNRHFAGTALERTGREGLLRNSSCVAANTLALALVDDLNDASQCDKSPVVRAHALWALARVASQGDKRARNRAKSAAERSRRDRVEVVCQEARVILENWV